MSIDSVNDCVMEKHLWHPWVPQGYFKDEILHTGFRLYYAYLDNILIALLSKNERFRSFVITFPDHYGGLRETKDSDARFRIGRKVFRLHEKLLKVIP